MDDGPLNRLEKNAAALNAESDRFREQVEAIGGAVNDMGLGVEVEHQGWGYGKILQKRWGFYKIREGNKVPIMECPRSERIGFAVVLDALLENLEEAGGSEFLKVKRANDLLEAQLNRLAQKRDHESRER